jgi:hypothetical protein
MVHNVMILERSGLHEKTIKNTHCFGIVQYIHDIEK